MTLSLLMSAACLVLIYFAVFMFAVAINKKKDATIWHSIMRRFPWAGTCTILASAPPTPTLPRFTQDAVPIIHAPKPKHARMTTAKRPPVFSWRSGLSHEYHIEHYRPQTNGGAAPSHSVQHASSRSVELPQAAAPPVISAPVLPPITDAETSDNNFASLLYPMYMQQAVYNVNTPARPEPALVSTNGASQATRAPLPVALPPSPPPLGNWPRPDILSRPAVKRKRKLPPIAPRGDSEFRNSGVGGSQALLGPVQREREARQSTAPSSFQPMRPVGPRRRSGSSDLSNKPQALDLPRVEYA